MIKCSMPTALVALLLMAAAASSQVFVHVPDNSPGVGTCNLIPFGQSALFSFGTSYMGRVPAAFMDPANPTIDEVSFASCASGTWAGGGLGSTRNNAYWSGYLWLSVMA